MEAPKFYWLTSTRRGSLQSHLMDRSLFDFAGLKPDGAPRPDGDTAFDHEDPAAASGAGDCGSDTAASGGSGTAAISFVRFD